MMTTLEFYEKYIVKGPVSDADRAFLKMYDEATENGNKLMLHKRRPPNPWAHMIQMIGITNALMEGKEVRIVTNGSIAKIEASLNDIGIRFSKTKLPCGDVVLKEIK